MLKLRDRGNKNYSQNIYSKRNFNSWYVGIFTVLHAKITFPIIVYSNGTVSTHALTVTGKDKLILILSTRDPGEMYLWFEATSSKSVL